MPTLNGRFFARRSVSAGFVITAVVCLTTVSVHAGTLSFITYTTVNGLGSNSVNAVFASGNTIYAATAGGLSISTNGGVRFTNYTTANGLGSNFVQDVFASGSAIYAATGNGLSISTNGGGSFTNYTTANGLGGNNVYGAYADSAAVYAATSGSGISISTNGGLNWTRYTTANGLAGNNANDVFSTGGIIYAAGGGLSTSANGGANWATIISSNSTLYCVYASGSSIYVGVKAGGLRVSNDNGASWTNYTMANGLGGNDPFGVYAIGSTIYAAASGVSVSANGGANWSHYTTANGLGSNGVRGVFADSNYVYAATSNGLSIAAVPEPSNYALALAGLACGGFSIRRRRKRVQKLRPAILAASLGLIAVLLASGPADAGPVSIDWVTVGNPGNAGQTLTYQLFGPVTLGAVDKEYRIMTFEFTNSQYAAFLNAIDPDGTNPNSVWSSSMGSDARGGISFMSGNVVGNKYAVRSNMGNKPVIYVSWWDAARASNWLHNGAQTYGSTDASAGAPQNTGAYTVGTATSGPAPAKNVGAQYWIPTENEWYKAAYYNPTLNNNVGGYRLYGNGFDTTPGIVSANEFGDGTAGDTGNFANYNDKAVWNGQTGNVTTVGTNGGASFYGAFDMSGNVWEWNDLSESADSFRGIRGGPWYVDFAASLSSYDRNRNDPSIRNFGGGFRLASPVAVPEPSTYAMALAGLACGGYLRFRRRKQA